METISQQSHVVNPEALIRRVYSYAFDVRDDPERLREASRLIVALHERDRFDRLTRAMERGDAC